MTWREYVLTFRAVALKRSHEFEHTRAICYTLAAINRDPNKSMQSIEKFWPLPTDAQSEVDEKTEEARLIEILEKHKKWMTK